MIVYLDNIIFSLHPDGSRATRLWSAMVRSLQQERKSLLRYVEYRGAVDNPHRRLLDIARRGRLFIMRHLWLTRHLPVPIDGYDGQPFIFHSSGYRLCSNPQAVNVITVHSPYTALSWLQRRALARCHCIICPAQSLRRSLPSGLRQKATIVTPRQSPLKAYKKQIR